MEKDVTRQASESLNKYSRSTSEKLDYYFKALAQEIDELSSHFQTAKKELEKAEEALNRAYAKRIVDWATGVQEPLNDMTIRKRIGTVDRVFGTSMEIKVRGEIELLKNNEDMSAILQEKIAILRLI